MIDLISLRQAARELHISERTVRRAVRSGELPAFQLGERTLRVDRAELLAVGAREAHSELAPRVALMPRRGSRRNLVKRGSTWYFERIIHGRRFRRSLETGNLEEAIARRDRLEKSLAPSCSGPGRFRPSRLIGLDIRPRA